MALQDADGVHPGLALVAVHPGGPVVQAVQAQGEADQEDADEQGKLDIGREAPVGAAFSVVEAGVGVAAGGRTFADERQQQHRQADQPAEAAGQRVIVMADLPRAPQIEQEGGGGEQVAPEAGAPPGADGVRRET